MGSLSLTANGNEVFTISPPEEGHVRRDLPRNISTGLKNGQNVLSITCQDDFISEFALALVRTSAPMSVSDLVAEVTVCGEEAARARVCSLLAEHKLYNIGDDAADDGVTCLISNRLRLRCPLSMERVKDPVRGDRCWHLQCFGLRAYLEANAHMRAFNNRWTCPVCSNVLHPGDLRIDGFVEKVLNETSEAVEEVILDADGNWQTSLLNPDLAGGPISGPSPMPPHLPILRSCQQRTWTLRSTQTWTTSAAVGGEAPIRMKSPQ